VAERKPQYFGRLLAHYDELYIAVHFLLENYYLRHYGILMLFQQLYHFDFTATSLVSQSVNGLSK